MNRCPETILRDTPHFPRRLADDPKAPDFLQVLGHLPDAPRAIAAVGARAASGHAMALARELAADIAADGGLVVSGGAVGIDAAAHRGALDAGGATAVVLGGGLDQLYPARNRPLFDDILAAGGALASSFAAGTAPRPGTFVRRNRVIAGLVDLVLVVEAGPGSGALHTARFAEALGRVVAAVPGSPGTETLIAQGAAVVTSIDDLRAALAGRPRRPEIELPICGSEEARVLAALADDPLATERLIESTGLPVGAVSRALTGLELEGLAILLPGRTYVRSTLARELLVR